MPIDRLEQERLHLVPLLQNQGRELLDACELLGLEAHELPQPRGIKLRLGNLVELVQQG